MDDHAAHSGATVLTRHLWVKIVQATLFVTKKAVHKMWVGALVQQILEVDHSLRVAMCDVQ